MSEDSKHFLSLLEKYPYAELPKVNNQHLSFPLKNNSYFGSEMNKVSGTLLFILQVYIHIILQPRLSLMT